MTCLAPHQPLDQRMRRHSQMLIRSVFAALAPLFLATAVSGADNSDPIDEATLQRVYDEVKTPFKYGIVLRGEASEKIDCPSVFRHGDKWFMVYIAFDGSGYETRLARSEDLLNWKPLGPILKRHAGGWDAEQAAGGVALVDCRWGGTCEIQAYQGKYWLSYLGGQLKGYETPPLSIGLAHTQQPDQAQEWTRLPENPVLTPSQPGARAFEHDTLFKSYVFHDPDRKLGAPFVMAYNARQKGKGIERIGLAVSSDLAHWERSGADPVIDNGPKPGISGDPQIVRLNDLWVMFYFGAFWRPHAFDTFAVSRDLAHWTKWTGPDLVTPSEPWDKEYAHKPWVIKFKGTVYHFYCAVGSEGRLIALATSRDLKGVNVRTQTDK